MANEILDKAEEFVRALNLYGGLPLFDGGDEDGPHVISDEPRVLNRARCEAVCKGMRGLATAARDVAASLGTELDAQRVLVKLARALERGADHLDRSELVDPALLFEDLSRVGRSRRRRRTRSRQPPNRSPTVRAPSYQKLWVVPDSCYVDTKDAEVVIEAIQLRLARVTDRPPLAGNAAKVFDAVCRAMQATKSGDAQLAAGDAVTLDDVHEEMNKSMSRTVVGNQLAPKGPLVKRYGVIERNGDLVVLTEAGVKAAELQRKRQRMAGRPAKHA